MVGRRCDLPYRVRWGGGCRGNERAGSRVPLISAFEYDDRVLSLKLGYKKVGHETSSYSLGLLYRLCCLPSSKLSLFLTR